MPTPTNVKNATVKIKFCILAPVDFEGSRRNGDQKPFDRWKRNRIVIYTFISDEKKSFNCDVVILFLILHKNCHLSLTNPIKSIFM